ncbi:CDP-alcohol phosphatidyltransferase family protein [Paeniglutamicibacter cryotolerans]|uniref:Phosphatidylglycerophosphate synthase n=1 Tax=Paeniglutamicibacter cryotolerans TaxID=670079 RepID=A0A839QMK8_9MICC|nr:CDP-alcohol phosphatidyltransferase family protein [Paeniglutamicibacter cryotolerans]MBB2995994.1 phosphatidylglycerophosphate synthase [Paeniglutamicibacter cryotolerans]
MENDVDDQRLNKTYVEIYTRWVIDPLAVPTARWLSRFGWVTPNRITAVSGITGLGAALCLFTGLLPLGGALFLIRFFIDCLDGKVARAQGTSSERGAALDLVMDVSGILLCSAALSWHLVVVSVLSPAIGFGLLVALGIFNWLLQYRKQLAERHAQGTGGANRAWSTDLPLIGSYVRWSKKMQMNPVPYTVEMETLALGVLPLFSNDRLAAVGITVALVFYSLACVVNFRRVWRIAGEADHTRTIRGEK